ncbi:MAG: DNA double-strand break repair nuclease NurA [Candidatus Bathyarchaeota archaeon]|nr:DNA double-strand break repair nuclease NurA [Candidatus Bathyarchaeota archaeon]
MKFIGEFVQEIRQNRSTYDQLFNAAGINEKLETDLCEELKERWHPLPSGDSPFSNEYAVDSSSAARTLENGVEFFITRGLMIGTSGEAKKKLNLKMRRGSTDVSYSFNYERILRDLIEIEVINENMDSIPENSIILLDGNLHGRYTHLIGAPFGTQNGGASLSALSVDLIDAMQRLYENCQEHNSIVIGVSKFSKTQNYTIALKRKLGYGEVASEYLDVEMLYKWKTGETGITHPILLGLSEDQKSVQSSRFNQLKNALKQTERSEYNRRIKALNEYGGAPAIVMYHLLAKEHYQPLRVDIPACFLGLNYNIVNSPHLEFVDPELVSNVTRQVASDFGGRDVYNALLYVVDKEVRLSGKIVDTVYKSVLSEELGVPMNYDRSSRRFAYA